MGTSTRRSRCTSPRRSFPVEIRALGVGLPYALTLALFGGTADMVALWSKRNGMESGFYGYVTACIARSLPV